jgi:hypothetical protein
MTDPCTSKTDCLYFVEVTINRLLRDSSMAERNQKVLMAARIKLMRFQELCGRCLHKENGE